MGNTVFTASGCSRCKIAKRFMDERAMPYQEWDVLAEGKDTFGQFYRNNRGSVHRGKEGIEFPIWTDGTLIRQGLGVVIAFLLAGARLDGFIGRSELSHGWMDGIHVSEGDPAWTGELVEVLGYIRKNGIKLQLDTDGRNGQVLERLLAENLGDRVRMEVKGPLSLYPGLIGVEIDPAEVIRTIGLTTRFPEYRFQTTVGPGVGRPGALPDSGCLTPEEVAETARLIQETTGSHRQPYVLRYLEPEGVSAEPRTGGDSTPNDLFRHRSAARKFQVQTETEKG